MTQQPPGYAPPPAQQPKSHLALAILATIFCFPITGIVAIVKAAQVNGFWVGGNYAGAEASSKSAMKWILWSVAIAVIIAVIYAILFATGVMTADIDTSTS
ncbi:CD225/dispanin family protein [Mycobacterium crocinum]|uniref:CD225/dispanin family protein n=1 Tax=Mycolicibacterium crocinum TaxID=388459 RepID=A0ABY3TE42_9MYCO|nr:CD225/dispanin family protein [Mycolicibacterium crocinum]MCV7217962.1 CD225/dispanin family protein [Mycolicibacterium crocinum]ULN39658.1 CD225/dispanin family protein [Mycolicibacterium crocinum]